MMDHLLPSTLRTGARRLLPGLLLASAWACQAQDFNVDFGEPTHQPEANYSAAGQTGYWHSLPALHGTTTPGLMDVSGQPTNVALVQIGGLETVTVSDPDTAGNHALLMDDYLVTFDADLESCIFLDGMRPGTYEVIIYARMPQAPAVFSDTFVDQEPGVPHYSIGGPWPGGHLPGVTHSRHLAIVGADGNLDFHSGIVADANPLLGAAMNGFQIRFTGLFKSGFEAVSER